MLHKPSLHVFLKLPFYGLLLLLLGSCGTSRDVVGKGWIQKRKYTKGYHLNMGQKRSKQPASNRQRDTQKNVHPIPSLPQRSPNALLVAPLQTSVPAPVVTPKADRVKQSTQVTTAADHRIIETNPRSPKRKILQRRSKPAITQRQRDERPAAHPWALRSVALPLGGLLVSVLLLFAYAGAAGDADSYRAIFIAYFGFLGALIVFGYMAVRDATRALRDMELAPGKWSGKGTAKLGLVIGVIFLLLALVLAAPILAFLLGLM